MISVLVFLAGSVASLGVLRPIARRHIRLPALVAHGHRRARRPEGDRDAARRSPTGGRVRIGGEEWSARSYLDGEVYAEGATVDVVKIEGATALVAE